MAAKGQPQKYDRIPEQAKMVNPKDNLSILDRLRWAYFQFTLATCTYMLDPWERHLADACFVALFTMIVYACCTYLPTYGLHLIRMFASIFISAPPSAT